MEAAGEAPLAHHQTERQHEQSTDPSHDVGDGHQSGLVRLWDVVATFFQVDAVKRALHRSGAKLIMHCQQTNAIEGLGEAHTSQQHHEA